jgi:catalase
MTIDQLKPTTTDCGIPVPSDDHSLTIGPDGPILLQDHYLIEQMANFNRERIPERQPHAKGSSAFGYFEVLPLLARNCSTMPRLKPSIASTSEASLSLSISVMCPSQLPGFGV